MAQWLVVLLAVLKILAITIASIVALALLVILLVLLVPIRYNAKGFYKSTPASETGEDIKDYSFVAKASWLLKFISVTYDIKRDDPLIIKLLGFRILKKLGSSDEDIESEAISNKSKVLNESDSKSDSDTKSDSDNEISEDIEESSKETFITKLKRFKSKWDYYKNIIQSERFKRALNKTKTTLKKVIKSIIPRKFSLKGRIVTDDPYKNGQIMGIAGFLYGFLYPKVEITSDFDEPGTDISGYAKGRIFLIVILFDAFVLFVNKDVRRIVKMFQNG